MEQKLLQIELKGLKGKMDIFEKMERGGVTYKQLVCGFILCVMLNLFFNLVMIGIENQAKAG